MLFQLLMSRLIPITITVSIMVIPTTAIITGTSVDCYCKRVNFSSLIPFQVKKIPHQWGAG